MRYDLHHGDCLEVMPQMEANSIDTIITDPPYGLSFMGKDWDHGIPGARFWREALRVAKPGAMLLAFGGTRTHHRLMVAIEDAGWEIRDVIMWVYGSGFPKSHDISKAIDKAAGAKREEVGYVNATYDDKSIRQKAIGKKSKTCYGKYAYNGFGSPITAPATDAAREWHGYGTALKPAYEPIIVAMKPLDGTFANNALTHGVAGLWVDGGRVGTEAVGWSGHGRHGCTSTSGASRGGRPGGYNFDEGEPRPVNGRWPANLIHDGSDEVLAGFPVTTSGKLQPHHKRGEQVNVYGKSNGAPPSADFGGDTGSAARFFMACSPSDIESLSRIHYCAKASRSERNAGLEGMEAREDKAVESAHSTVCAICGRQRVNVSGECKCDNPQWERRQQKAFANHHPTVKPLALMRYLARITRTPSGGVVLDPFMGSGSTGMGAVMEGRDFVGIELDADYLEIAQRRIVWAEAEAEREGGRQLGLFTNGSGP